MIKFINIINSEPYNLFEKFYKKALDHNEKFIEAISVSSYDKTSNQVDSRYVNLKYIIKDEWVFFSNYNSPKSVQFRSHDQVAITILWKSIYTQIRLIAKIKQSPSNLSDKHFNERSDEKNALAVSSNQSGIIESYEDVVENYEKTLEDKKKLLNRPEYWGGFSFKPYSFEFWEGNDFRLNKRVKYTNDDSNDGWTKFYLQP